MSEETSSIETLLPGRLERLYVPVTKQLALPSSYRPHDLTIVDRATGPVRVRRKILPYLTAMLDACSPRRSDLLVVSGYRSHAYQARVFARFVDSELERGLLPADAERAANRYSARPGHSEHQLGTTVDVGVPELQYALTRELELTKAGRWLLVNAHRFGFVFSYPDRKEHLTGYVYEPWHLRWLGPEHATLLHRQAYLEPDCPITVAAYLQRLQALLLASSMAV